MATMSIPSDQDDKPSIKAPDTFTLFPRLPIELRLKIWRLGFPRGRQVSFAAFAPGISPKDSEVIRKKDLLGSPLPITLFVNNESRTETMKHYLMVSRRYTDRLRTVNEEPFCYNPNLDLAWIAPLTILGHYHTNWMGYLKSKAPEAFSKTKVLEVRFWDWDTAFNSERIHGERFKMVANYGHNEWQMEPFLYFTSLEHLKLIRNFDFHPVNLDILHYKDDIGVQFLADRIRDWLKENKDCFFGGAPLVTVEEKELSCA
jgi:hypothetical protein